MKEIIKLVTRTFFLVCTCILFAAAIYISIFYKDATLTVSILWQIIIISFIASILSIVFYSKTPFSKHGMLIRQCVHFILLLASQLICAWKFDWVHIDSIMEVTVFILMVVVVYIGVCVIIYRYDIKTADQINQRIQELQKNDINELD